MVVITPACIERIKVMKRAFDQTPPDYSVAMALLNTVAEAWGPETTEPIFHAREAIAAAFGNDHRHEALARYAVDRMLTALETEVPGDEGAK